MPAAAVLLPPASTPLERAYADSTDLYARMNNVVTAMRGVKLTNPPPSFLPYLIYEYGLGELTPYVDNLYDLIEAGIRWQRVRGTPRAIEIALDWIGYEADLEEFPTRRRHWNYFMLELDRVRDEEEPDLFRVEGISNLSTAVRSVFWRGFSGYDVRPLEYGHTRWSGAIWGAYSGVRIPPTEAKWSFGRTYDYAHDMTQSELEALGVWIAEPGEGGQLSWGSFPWPSASWVDLDAEERSEIMLSGVASGPAWVVFKDGEGEVIGYRRARARHGVVPAGGGIYQVGAQSYAIETESPIRLYVEAMTDFGDGYGSTAVSAGIIFGAEPVGGHPVGALWLPPGGLDPAGPIVAEREVDIEFGRTVRERVRTLLRF